MLTCPHCNISLETLCSPEEGDPAPGAILGCFDCQGVSEFTDSLELVPVTPETLEETDFLQLTRMNNKIRSYVEFRDEVCQLQISEDTVTGIEDDLAAGEPWLTEHIADVLGFQRCSDMPVEVRPHEHGYLVTQSHVQ